MTSASVSEVNTAPASTQLLLELEVVLDDAVDDDVDAVVGVEVRVGVLLGDAAVRGPAGVADAGRGRPRGDGDAAVLVRRRCAPTAARRLAEVADGADGVAARRRSSSEMPAESYPRYSSFSRPASRMSCTGRCVRHSRRCRTWGSAS